MRSRLSISEKMDKNLRKIVYFILLSIALGSDQYSTLTTAQDVKGFPGSTSSFRQNILSVQQKRVKPPVLVNSNTQQSFSSSSSSTIQRQPVVQTSSVSNVVEQDATFSNQADSEPAVYGSVDGVPGVDFPGFTSIPNTPFSCEGRPFDPGMYADESTGCQVYHLCYQGRRESFLCGIGTVFNQAILNCDFWHSVDCARSSEYYHLNSEFGKASSEPASSSSFSKQQVSTNFVSSAAPTAVQNYVNKLQSQFSQVTRTQPPPPILNLQQQQQQFQASRVESSGFARPVSSLLVTGADGFGGKTSQRREQQNSFTSASNALSPGQQLQLNRGFQFSPNLESNQAAGSETSKVISKVSDPSPAVSSAASSLNVAQTSATGQQQQQAGYGTKSGKASGKFAGFRGNIPPNVPAPAPSPAIGKGLVNEIQQTADDGNEWKVYFKNKASPAPARRPISGPRSTTTTTSTTTAPTSTVQSLSTEASPDEDPSFSINNNNDQTAKELPKPPKSSPPPDSETGSVESDVRDALTTTLPASSTTADTSTSGETTANSPQQQQQPTTERVNSREDETTPTTTGLPPTAKQADQTTPTVTATTETPSSTTTDGETTTNNAGSSVTYEKESTDSGNASKS